MPQSPVKTTLFVSQIIAGSGISVTNHGTGVVTIAVSGSEAPTAIVGGANPFPITGQAAASASSAGGAVAIAGAAGGATSGAGGAVILAGGAATTSGNGGIAQISGGNGAGAGNGGQMVVQGGTSGTGSTGNGGSAELDGGAAASTNGSGGDANVAGGAGTGTGIGGSVNVRGGNAAGSGNGGDVVLSGGTSGSGVPGNVVNRGTALITHQDAPTAVTTSATLTAAQVLTGIITVNQGAAGASAQQLPLATAMDAAIPNSLANDAFDFSVINISTNAAETASLTTNTGWTLVGDMDVSANSAATTKSAGRFRARKTAAGAWTLYRLS